MFKRINLYFAYIKTHLLRLCVFRSENGSCTLLVWNAQTGPIKLNAFGGLCTPKFGNPKRSLQQGSHFSQRTEPKTTIRRVERRLMIPNNVGLAVIPQTNLMLPPNQLANHGTFNDNINSQ